MRSKILFSAALCLGVLPLAAGAETCGVPSGDYVVFYDSEQIGTVRIGETPSGLVMDGTVGDDKVSYRVQSCAQEGMAHMIPNYQSPGPNPIYLSGGANGVVLQYQDDTGQWDQLDLVQ